MVFLDRRTDLGGVELLEVDRRALSQLLDLALTEPKPRPLPNLIGRLVKRAAGGLDRREATNPVRGSLDWQVQRAISDIQVLLATTAVRQPRDRDLSEHARKRPAVIALDRPAHDTRAVLDTVNAPLPLSAKIEMILKQRAQQLTTVARKLGLQI